MNSKKPVNDVIVRNPSEGAEQWVSEYDAHGNDLERLDAAPVAGISTAPALNDTAAKIIQGNKSNTN